MIERKPPSAAVPTASSIEKWTTEDDFGENPYAAEYLRHQEEEKKRTRWASKRRKKKNKDAARIVDFDQIYDPEFPIRLEDYKGSEEQAMAEHEWKQLLHAHQFRRRPSSPRSSEEDDGRRMPASMIVLLNITGQSTNTEQEPLRLRQTTISRRRHLTLLRVQFRRRPLRQSAAMTTTNPLRPHRLLHHVLLFRQ